MKYWTIVFPGEHGQHVQETWSEDQIIASYWDYWCGKMTNVKKTELISRERCIDDWRFVHWAQQTDQWGTPLVGSKNTFSWTESRSAK
jgi:hypothetical protein